MRDRRIRSTVALAAMFALAGGSAAAAPGDLDPSFGRFGVQVFSSAGTMDPTDVAVQADGKLVVSGRLYSSAAYGGQPVIVRFAANGRVDNSFGDHGVVVLQPPVDGVSAVEIDPTGRIVAAGRSAEGAVAVARLNPDGTPDPAFGAGGIDATAVQVQGSLDLALTFPGEMVVVGGLPGVAGIVALKRLPDGGPDPSFSSDGIATTPPGAASYGGSVAVAVDGSVFAGGTRSDGAGASSGVLAKFRADGELDPTFGSGGLVLTSSAAGEGGDQVADLGLGPGATVTVLESSSDSFTASIARFGPSGALDPAFSDDGRVVIRDVSFSPKRIVVQPDGRIVAALGSRNGDGRVLRYLADGKRDRTFADRGEAAIGFGGNIDAAEFVARGPRGTIAVAGERGRAGFRTNYYDLAVARLLNLGHRQDLDADGHLDRRDRCPKLSASGHQGCPFFERGLTLRAAGGKLAGRVLSPDNGRCRRAGRVELVEKRPGRDRVVASTSEIEARGRYELTRPAGEGAFYTRAPAVVIKSLGLCGGARSDGYVSA